MELLRLLLLDLGTILFVPGHLLDLLLLALFTASSRLSSDSTMLVESGPLPFGLWDCILRTEPLASFDPKWTARGDLMLGSEDKRVTVSSHQGETIWPAAPAWSCRWSRS